MLHRWGSCYTVLGIDDPRYEYVGPGMSAPAAFDSIVRRYADDLRTTSEPSEQETKEFPFGHATRARRERQTKGFLSCVRNAVDLLGSTWF